MLSVSKLLKKSGHQIFINILTVMGVSMGWSLFIVPAVFILPIDWALIYLAIIFVPATVAVYAMMNYVLEGGRKRLFRFFKYFFYYFRRAFVIGLIFSLAVIIPLSEWWYYIKVNDSYYIFLFAVFQTYLCLTFLSSQVYTIPFLVKEDLPAFKAMNKSIKHFLKHTWYTVTLFIQIISVMVLLAISVIGFFLLYISMMSIFVLNATSNLAFYDQHKEKDNLGKKIEHPV